MIIQELRKASGKTIEDLSHETKLSVEYLEAVEEYRIIPTDIDLELISKALHTEVEIINENLYLSEKYSEGNKKFIQFINLFGCFDDSQYIKDSFNICFTLLINRLWVKCKNSFLNNFPRDIDVGKLFDKCILWEEQLFNIKINELIEKKKMQGAFKSLPFYSKKNDLFWIDIYRSDDIVDNILTIVIEVFRGRSFTNSYEFYLNEINSLLTNLGFHSINHIRYIYKKIDLFNSDNYVYTEFIKLKAENVKYKNIDFVSMIKKKENHRTYRLIVEAKSLPDPFQIDKNGNNKCSVENCAECPFETNIVPNKTTGCSYCRGIAGVWRARELIIKNLKDEEFRNILTLDKLKESNELIYNNLIKYCNDNKYEAMTLFKKVREFSMYNGNNSAYPITMSSIDGKLHYTDGRHRVKIAQLLGIKIPIFLIINKKLKKELIEG